MITRKTKSIGVVAILFFLGSAAAFSFAAYEIYQLGTSLEEEVNLVANNEALRRQATESNQLVEQTEAERNQLANFILTEDETINFLAEIERVAFERGVRLQTTSLNLVERSGTDFDSLEASFSFSGSDRQVREIVSMFETIPYENVITTMELSFNQGQVSGTLELILSIASYD
ncbi:MAG: hypothetical protein AAGA35_02580 [Patescibacteria group bacterium]